MSDDATTIIINNCVTVNILLYTAAK